MEESIERSWFETPGSAVKKTCVQELSGLLRSVHGGVSGPRWVDGALFGTLCNLVVALNLASMVLVTQSRGFVAVSAKLDHAFLAWYSAELTLKIVYHRGRHVL